MYTNTTQRSKDFYSQPLGTNKYVCQAFPVRNWQGTNLRLLREENLGLAARGILRKDLLRYRDLKDSEEQRREETNRL